MHRSRLPLREALMLTLCGLSACIVKTIDDDDGSGGAAEADADADADADSDADADADSDADTDPVDNPYTSLEGTVSLDYGYEDTPGTLTCQLVWGVSGTPVNPFTTACDGCEFLFDVDYTLDAAQSWTNSDDDCALDDGFTSTWGYSPDFDGYGGSWVYYNYYYGQYAWWGYGEFDGTSFVFHYDVVDYPYGGLYYTYVSYGNVTVQ